jgi:hypothetical protein
MGNTEGMDIDVTDTEVLTGPDGFDAAEAFAEGIGENALECVHGGLGDVERRFPEAEDLGETIAVVGVLVGDEDSVEAIDVAFNGGEAGESFAFS